MTLKVKAQSRFLLRPLCVEWWDSSRPSLFCALILSELLFIAPPSLYGEYTVWELHNWQITGILVFTIAEVFLILVLAKLALAQRRNLKKLTFQRELEALIAQLAAAFISLPAELVNEEIERAFSHLLQFFDLDRISLFEFSTETAELRPLCSRTVPGIEQPPSLIKLDQLKWAVSRMLQDTRIQASHLDDLPEEAGELKRVMSAHGVRSFIAFPLQRNGDIFAALVFSTTRNERKWEPNVVQLLQTVSDIFRSALERQHAEEAVFQSSTRLTGFIEAAMDAVVAVDRQQRIVVFNSAAERIFGCPAEEALGQSLERFIPQRFRSQHCAHIARFDETGVTNRAMESSAPLWALRASGEEFPIEATISQVQKGGSKLFTAIIRDITERKRSENSLRQGEELKTAILESLNNKVVVVDTKGLVVASTNRKIDFVAGNPLLGAGVGTNYFETCRTEIGENDPEAAMALEGTQAVFDGKRDHFEWDYAPDSASGRSCLLMSVTPLKGQGGIVISFQDTTERKRHEGAIHELSGRLISAQEQERTRIARELHDDVSQQLAVLAIELQQLERFFPEASSEGREQVRSIWKLTHELSMEVQQLSHQLHSAKLEHLGIVAALRGLSREFGAQYNIASDFQCQQAPPAIEAEVALALFRVAQEALHNVAKHSHATNVQIELVGENGNVELRVSDDGVGFDPEGANSQSGLGMISMRERVRFVGGTLSLRSKPSMGTQVEAVVPVTRKAYPPPVM